MRMRYTTASRATERNYIKVSSKINWLSFLRLNLCTLAAHGAIICLNVGLRAPKSDLFRVIIWKKCGGERLRYELLLLITAPQSVLRLSSFDGCCVADWQLYVYLSNKSIKAGLIPLQRHLGALHGSHINFVYSSQALSESP